MRSSLPTIARELGADERTLRRAAYRGALRCSRSSPRRLELDAGEREYLQEHWSLLSGVARALRTEPNVALAVLYGSAARGDDGPSSDVDLLVELRDDAPGAAFELAIRLEHALQRDVDVARVDRAWSTPLLLLQALDEGRVIVDREQRWPALRRRRAKLGRAASRRREEDIQEAAASYAELIGEPA